MTTPLYAKGETVKVGVNVATVMDVNTDFDDTPLSYDLKFAGVDYVTEWVPETVIDGMDPVAAAKRATLTAVNTALEQRAA